MVTKVKGSVWDTDNTYTPSGTGAVERTLQSKLDEFVSVKDFGAVGDGVTNDAPAIQLALDTGKPVYLPKSTAEYYIQSTLNMNQNDMILFGEGEIMADSSMAAGSNVILITGDRCKIEGITIDQNNIATGRSIRITNAADTTIRGVLAQNCQQAFIRADGLVTNLFVYECRMKDTKGFGVWIEDPDAGSSGLIVSNCHFKFTTGSGFGDGVEVNAPTNGFSNVVVSDNYFEGFYGDSANAGVGVGFAKVSNATISGNVVQNCESDGIHVEDESKSVTIVGNTVFNVCQSTTSSSGGIVIVTNSDDITVVGNTVRLTNQRPCFVSTSAAGDYCERLTIADNTFEGGLQYSMTIESVKDCTITGNVLYEMNTQNTSTQPAIRVTKFTTNVCDNLQITNNIIRSSKKVRSVSFAASSCTSSMVADNNFSGVTTPSPDLGSGNVVECYRNRLGTDAMSGTFTLTAAATSKIVNNNNVREVAKIHVYPLDAAAAALATYVSAVTIGGNFTLTHPSAAGGETFGYTII